MSERTTSRQDRRILSVVNFIEHPATLGTTAVINGLGSYAILKGHADDSARLFGGILAAEIAALNIGLAVHTGTKHFREKRRTREESRNYSEQENFTSYDYVDTETGGIYPSPFLVAVVGIRTEMLGLGKVIGGLKENGDPEPVPVIAIPDHHAPKGVVELRGEECYWLPADEEVLDLTIEAMAKNLPQSNIVPAFEYKGSLGY